MPPPETAFLLAVRRRAWTLLVHGLLNLIASMMPLARQIANRVMGRWPLAHAGSVGLPEKLLIGIRSFLRSKAARIISFGVLVGYWAVLQIPGSSDAGSFWTLDLASPYEAPWGAPDAFVYSPPVALLIAPFTQLPFPIFYKVLLATNLVALAWMLGGVRAALALVLPPVQAELQTGNIHLLLAAAIVVGFRFSAAWAWIALTKVTPAVGLLWFAARKEWKSLLVAAGSTAAIVVVTWALFPQLWVDWIERLIASATIVIANYTVVQVPVFVRLPVAAGIAVIAGWRGDRWLIPVAVLIALPAIWVGALTILLAVLPLLGRGEPPSAHSRQSLARVG
ncbi:MAG: glycosyltransferase family 87 protein [Candidatus Limnocylindria bacterium]